MNIDQAKQIPLEEILEKLGHLPQRRSGQQLWYLSPLRSEKTPSFKVNRQLNQWYDFGDGRHGDIIDLVCEVNGCQSVSETLRTIDELMGQAARPPTPPPVKSDAPAPQNPAIELVSIGPVKSQALLHYLRERGIEPKLATTHVQEARYKLPGKDREYFGLAFANDSGGFELRNPYQKLTLGHKDVSTLEGPSEKVVVFEGFMDYLTAVTMFSGPPAGTVIVLNSVALQQRALDKLQQLRPRTVELYRDHDAAGQSLLQTFRQGLPEAKIIDRSGLYVGYEDLNAWHASRRSQPVTASR